MQWERRHSHGQTMMPFVILQEQEEQQPEKQPEI
jgi:hypothetical protein